MDLDIVPYVGVGPLRFGMTPGQVHQTVGAPRRVKRAAAHAARDLSVRGAAHVRRRAGRAAPRRDRL
jgi:hypothetical protein